MRRGWERTEGVRRSESAGAWAGWRWLGVRARAWARHGPRRADKRQHHRHALGHSLEGGEPTTGGHTSVVEHV